MDGVALGWAFVLCSSFRILDWCSVFYGGLGVTDVEFNVGR